MVCVCFFVFWGFGEGEEEQKEMSKESLQATKKSPLKKRFSFRTKLHQPAKHFSSFQV